MNKFYNIISFDLTSIYKSIWIFSRILITWSVFPTGPLGLTSFGVGYYPDGETAKFHWEWDNGWWLQ